jgi:hypothetical protein
VEFKYIRQRGRADLHVNPQEDVVADFNLYDKNEVEDLLETLQDIGY